MKIRPNDPCLCGSGKKYKKCCKLIGDSRTLQGYTYDPDTPKKNTYAKKETCAYHNCMCDAINSHLLQERRWLIDIAEDGRVLQMCNSHMQPLLDGDENGNNYTLLSIKHAMSLPIYCQQHDQKLFKEVEERELDFNNEVHLLKLSYRAFCASVAQEKRRCMFYNINPQINPFCSGPVFDKQRDYSKYIINAFEKYHDDLYQHVKKRNTSDFVFKVVRINKLRLCLSDVFISEDVLGAAYERQEKEPQLFPLFMHALPCENESIFIFGYDKRQCNDRVTSYFDQWTKSIEAKEIFDDWLVMANNWCVSPSFFGDYAKGICEELMCKKLQQQMSY